MRRACGQSGSVKNGLTAASHAILHYLIGLRAGIGAGLTAIATVAARTRDHTSTGALLCGLGAGLTSRRAAGGAFDSGAGNAFTLRRIQLVLYS